MPHRNSEKSESAQTPFGFGTFAVFNGSVMNAMNHSRSTFEQSLRAFHEETLRFINRRLEENANAIESCQECESLADLLAVQQKWLTRAALDLYDESVHMGETMQRLLTDGMGDTAGTGVSELRKSKRRSEQQEAA
jgi:Phasin protein